MHETEQEAVSFIKLMVLTKVLKQLGGNGMPTVMVNKQIHQPGARTDQIQFQQR